MDGTDVVSEGRKLSGDYRDPGHDRDGTPGERSLHVLTTYAPASLRPELCEEKTYLSKNPSPVRFHQP